MIHIKAKVLGVLVAVVALGIAVAVPSIAVAEGGAPAAEAPGVGQQAAPAAEAAPNNVIEECGTAICVWPLIGFEPHNSFGVTACSASGVHGLNGTKASIINGCSNEAVWFRRNGATLGCKNPGTSNSAAPEFNELLVGGPGSRC